VLITPYALGNLCMVVLFALLLNIALGGPPAFWSSLAPLHPLALWRQFIGSINRRLNRETRERETRYKRGKLVVVLAVFFLLFAGMLMGNLLRALPYNDYLEVLMLALFIGARPVWDNATQVRRYLQSQPDLKDVPGDALPLKLLRREQALLDRPSVTRATIEYLALGLTQTVAAPILAYLLFSWPGVFLVMGIKAMDNQLGYRNRHFEDFGKATAKLDSVLQWLPSRLTGLWLGLVSFFAPARPLKALSVMFKDADKVSSSNAGWPIGAMAGALGLSLAGPRSLHGAYIEDRWLGDGSPKAELSDLKRAKWLYAISLLLLLLVLLLCTAL
jgi:adenosylcobinamide-phosphate synthase